MADRERNDLRKQIVAMRQVLEAHERRRSLLRQQERPRGVRALGAALGSGTRWARERPVRLLATAVVVLLGAASSVAPSPVGDDEPHRPSVAASPETGHDVQAEATVTLNPAGSDGDEEPDADPTVDSGGVPDGQPGGDPAGESDQAQGADPASASSGDQDPQATAEGSGEPSSAGRTDSATSAPTPAPELSDTGEPDDGPSEPEPTESPEPQSPDDDADDGTCLGVNALGLTVDLCVPSLLGS